MCWDEAVSAAAHAMALKEFECLMDAEEADSAGEEGVQALQIVYWRLNPVARASHLAHTQGLAEAARFQGVIAENLGDSRMIEVAHQHGKDLLSKHDTFADVTIMAQTLRSGALVKVSNSAKVR